MERPASQQQPPSGDPDDATLVENMAGGDPSALRAFYDRHSPVIYGLCCRVLGDPHEAEDVLVDVFHEFWTRVASFDPERGSPLALLLTLARSRAIDRRRSVASRGGKLPTVELKDFDSPSGAAAASSPSSPPEQTLIRQQDGESIRAALDALDPQHREAIEAVYYSGLTHSEAAEALHKPLGTLKTYVRRGLLQLRSILCPYPGAIDSPMNAKEGGQSS